MEYAALDSMLQHDADKKSSRFNVCLRVSLACVLRACVCIERPRDGNVVPHGPCGSATDDVGKQF